MASNGEFPRLLRDRAGTTARWNRVGPVASARSPLARHIPLPRRPLHTSIAHPCRHESLSLLILTFRGWGWGWVGLCGPSSRPRGETYGLKPRGWSRPVSPPPCPALPRQLLGVNSCVVHPIARWTFSWRCRVGRGQIGHSAVHSGSCVCGLLFNPARTPHILSVPGGAPAKFSGMHSAPLPPHHNLPDASGESAGEGGRSAVVRDRFCSFFRLIPPKTAPAHPFACQQWFEPSFFGTKILTWSLTFRELGGPQPERWTLTRRNGRTTRPLRNTGPTPRQTSSPSGSSSKFRRLGRARCQKIKMAWHSGRRSGCRCSLHCQEPPKPTVLRHCRAHPPRWPRCQ